ncbi:MAG: BamA/TamA family outer membrane protein, partial [Bacteroidales bacterium]|nr:BamA/TamA family outer membrane protein [Bacteroidales bacterium]
MKTRVFITLLIATLFSANLFAQQEKKEITKTGYNFGPLPAVAFDADKGFQLGALLNIYDFGDGTVYPNTRQQWYFEASFFTKGSQLFVVSYDSKFLIPGVRFSTALAVTNDKAMDFYGFNGYQSYYDYEKVQAGKDGDSYLYTPMYRTNRLAALFKTDFIGNIWDNKLFWEAGYHLSHFKQGAINREKINKNKDENQIYPDSEPTLYEMYREWGIIPDNVANGGTNSTIRLGLLYDTRDKEGAPSKGIWAEAHATIAPKWLGTTNPYYKYSATWRHYIPIVDNDILTFAYRLNYQGTFGKDAPYYVLPYITT